MARSFVPPLPLLKILAVTGIHHDGTLPSMIQATQKQWLRKEGSERWEMGDQFEELQEQLVPLFEELGILNEKKPAQMEYDYLVVLGDIASDFRARLAQAFRYYENGIRFKKLVIHAGARPLVPEFESKEVLFDRTNPELPIRADWQEPAELPHTESEMVRMIFDQAQLPVGFKENVLVEFVDAPMQISGDGSMRRPNTGDVVKVWLAQNPAPGTVLAISNQPYVIYQDAVLRAMLPCSFKIETVGAAASHPLRMGEILDTLARWLYMENYFFCESLRS